MNKRRGIPRQELDAEKFLIRLWKELKIGNRKLINWLFFYQPIGGWKSMDAILHIVAVVAWIYLGMFCISK